MEVADAVPTDVVEAAAADVEVEVEEGDEEVGVA